MSLLTFLKLPEIIQSFPPVGGSVAEAPGAEQVSETRFYEHYIP